MTIHTEKALDGTEVRFEIWCEWPSSSIPQFCTYCGSKSLTEGNLGGLEDGITCLNCGASIHDCCSQTGYHEFQEFMKEHRGNDGNE